MATLNSRFVKELTLRASTYSSSFLFTHCTLQYSTGSKKYLEHGVGAARHRVGGSALGAASPVARVHQAHHLVGTPGRHLRDPRHHRPPRRVFTQV